MGGSGFGCAISSHPTPAQRLLGCLGNVCRAASVVLSCRGGHKHSSPREERRCYVKIFRQSRYVNCHNTISYYDSGQINSRAKLSTHFVNSYFKNILTVVTKMALIDIWEILHLQVVYSSLPSCMEMWTWLQKHLSFGIACVKFPNRLHVYWTLDWILKITHTTN